VDIKDFPNSKKKLVV
jgi:RNA recognition motif-containing protein